MGSDVDDRFGIRGVPTDLTLLMALLTRLGYLNQVGECLSQGLMSVAPGGLDATSIIGVIKREESPLEQIRGVLATRASDQTEYIALGRF